MKNRGVLEMNLKQPCEISGKIEHISVILGQSRCLLGRDEGQNT